MTKELFAKFDFYHEINSLRVIKMSLNNVKPGENKKSSDHKNEMNILLINRGAVTSGG